MGRDPKTFQCKGFGYVLLKDSSLINVAVGKIHGSVYMKRTLRVMECNKKFKGKKGERTNVRKDVKKRISNERCLKYKKLKSNEFNVNKVKRKRGVKKSLDKIHKKQSGMSKRGINEKKLKQKMRKM